LVKLENECVRLAYVVLKACKGLKKTEIVNYWGRHFCHQLVNEILAHMTRAYFFDLMAWLKYRRE